MKSIRRSTVTASVVAVLLGMSGCAGMSTRDKNTVLGATVGGVAGSVLSNGSAIGTVGGAAVGGVIGNGVGTRR